MECNLTPPLQSNEWCPCRLALWVSHFNAACRLSVERRGCERLIPPPSSMPDNNVSTMTTRGQRCGHCSPFNKIQFLFNGNYQRQLCRHWMERLCHKTKSYGSSDQCWGHCSERFNGSVSLCKVIYFTLWSSLWLWCILDYWICSTLSFVNLIVINYISYCLLPILCLRSPASHFVSPFLSSLNCLNFRLDLRLSAMFVGFSTMFGPPNKELLCWNNNNHSCKQCWTGPRTSGIGGAQLRAMHLSSCVASIFLTTLLF